MREVIARVNAVFHADMRAMLVELGCEHPDPHVQNLLVYLAGVVLQQHTIVFEEFDLDRALVPVVRGIVLELRPRWGGTDGTP